MASSDLDPKQIARLISAEITKNQPNWKYFWSFLGVLAFVSGGLAWFTHIVYEHSRSVDAKANEAIERVATLEERSKIYHKR